MRVGILTFIHTSNYGAALQAYALQCTMEAQGVQCELIDYSSAAIQRSHNPASVARERTGLVRRLTAPLTYVIYAIRLNRFEQFERRRCKMSSRRYDRQSIAETADIYDRIVVGSDQVWNTVLTNDDDAYFLPFAKSSEQRCSYAASFGGEYLPEANRGVWESMLQRFSVLSLREAAGQIRLRGALNRKVYHDLDPTLLFPPEKWKEFVGKRPRKRDYIFVYMIPEQSAILQAIEKLAQEKCCDLYWVRKGIRGKRGFHILNTLSPESFLNYLFHARYVVTGSFHAMCFSLIYQKEFFYTESCAAERSVRLLELAARLGIENRKLTMDASSAAPVPYAEISLELKTLRAASLKTIQTICGQAHRPAEDYDL